MTWRISWRDSSGVIHGGPEEQRVRVRVEDQAEDAKVVIDGDGEPALVVREGLISARAFVALGVSLAAVALQREQHLQNAG